MVVKWLIQGHRDIKIQSWDSKESQFGFRTQVNKNKTEDRRPTQQWPLSPALSKPSSERESEEKAHVIILRSLRTMELGIWWERRASPELQVQSTDSLQELCRTWLGPSYFCNVVPIFSTDGRLREFQISVPGGRVSPRHQSLTHQDDQPHFFLLPMPFLPSTHANHSSLGFPAESQVWIVWKDIWYPGVARSPSQGEAIVHSSGLSDILYARITLD